MQYLTTQHRQEADWSLARLFVDNALCLMTKRDYAAEVRLFAEHVRKPASQVTLADLLEYRKELEERGLKPATIAKKCTVLRRLFTFLHDQGYMPRNPSAGLQVPKVRNETSRDVLTLAECYRLLEAIDTSTLRGLRDYAICSMCLLLGLRACEIVRANAEDIRRADDYWILRIHGKGGLEAETRLRDDLYAVIERYLQARGEVSDDAPLFLGTNHRAGGRLTTRTVQYMFEKYLQKAGIDRAGISLHSTRHTAVSMVILSGASILKAQEFARHSDPKTTTRYFHNAEKLKDHAVLLHPLQVFSMQKPQEENKQVTENRGF